VKIPYVIDNQEHVLRDLLVEILEAHGERSLDVATAYFTVGGYGLIKDGLEGLGNFRLLLGAEPQSGDQVGLRPSATRINGLIKQDLEALPFDEKTLRLVEDLIAYLRRESVKIRLYDGGFLHAKCWLFYSDRPGQQQIFDRFKPVLAIVGSSNFTAPGLTSNRELNLAHKVLLNPQEIDDPEATIAVSWLSDARPSRLITAANQQLLKSEVGARAIIDLERWYERQWADSKDYKDELIQLLDNSKFGQTEYTPYEVYMKALFEYFKDDLDKEEESEDKRTAVDLAEFQKDAVAKARKILARYDGVMIADSVGLGKTWIGKKLLEDYAYHMRQKALVVCPASLRDMWTKELHEASIAAKVVSQEELGREDFDPEPWTDADVILIDESHNFRNRNAQRYESIERIIGAKGGRGRDGSRKKTILLTATPINNDLLDLYQQLNLITHGDRGYFSVAGIGDLYRYFLRARRESRNNGSVTGLFNLMEEIIVRRTRPFIRKAYPEATIRGKKVFFPERELKTLHYNLEETYQGIYKKIVQGVETLKLPPYNLESYKRPGIERDDFELGREQALVGIFKSRYLKRFESSIEAFRISIRRALAFLKTFESYILDGKLLKSSDFRGAIRFIVREDEDDDATPASLAGEIDENEEARVMLDGLEKIKVDDYDLRRLHDAVQSDVETLSEIWSLVKEIKPANDAKLNRLKGILSNDLRGKKVLIFSYYKDTARYLYRHLGDPDNPEALAFCERLGGANIRRMDSDANPKDRGRIIQGFAPKANEKSDWIGTDKEIDILISTDVLSEGQNLQDCGNLINYDLHWNPTRMVQRAGRIDRLGTDFKTLWIHNMYPDKGLEDLLGLVERLSRKISDIDRAGFLDASVLGETVHPKNFNTLKRIHDEDNTVIQEEELFSELASSEFLLQQLKNLLNTSGADRLKELPDGIHSGLIREGYSGVFFYFQADVEGKKQHYWRYYSFKDQSVLDNRYLIANLIASDKDTARIVDPERFAQVFDVQEKIIQDILDSISRRRGLEIAPKTIDPVQQTVATLIQDLLNHPDVDRTQAIQLIRFLNQPMMQTPIKTPIRP